MSWRANQATSQKLFKVLSLLAYLFGRWKCPNLSQASPVHELMRHPAVRKLLRTMHENLGAILSPRFSLPSSSSDPFPFYPSLRGEREVVEEPPREESSPIRLAFPPQRGLIISFLRGSLFPYFFLQPNRYFKAFSSYSCLKFYVTRRKMNMSG